MRIEISKQSKTKFTDSDLNMIRKLVNKCINTYCLISEIENRTLFVLECVPENCAEDIAKQLSANYKINLKEDSFMAEIDLRDMLSGGLW